MNSHPTITEALAVEQQAEQSRVTDRLTREQEHVVAAQTEREAERLRGIEAQGAEETALRAELFVYRAFGDGITAYPEMMEDAGRVSKRLRVLEQRRELSARLLADAQRKAATPARLDMATRFQSLDGLRMVVRVIQHDDPQFYALAIGTALMPLPSVGFLDATTAPAFEEALAPARISLARVLSPRDARLVEIIEGDEMWDPKFVLGVAGVPVTASSGVVTCGAWLQQAVRDTRVLLRWAMAAEVGLEGSALFTPRDMRARGTSPLAEACFEAASYCAANRAGAMSIQSAAAFWESLVEQPDPVERDPVVRKRLTKVEAVAQRMALVTASDLKDGAA